MLPVPLDGHPICIVGLDFVKLMERKFFINSTEFILGKNGYHYLIRKYSYLLTSSNDCIYVKLMYLDSQLVVKGQQLEEMVPVIHSPITQHRGLSLCDLPCTEKTVHSCTLEPREPLISK